jgi:hypothetical protein
MTIQHCKESFVLCGPPIRLIAEASPDRPDRAIGDDPMQLSLF